MALAIKELPAASKIFRIVDRGEAALLCILLLTMIVLACTQIVLRNVFSGGLLWADGLLRYLVLWSGLLGAVTATGKGKHIALDVLGGRLSGAAVPFISLFTYLFCTLASAGLTWAGWLFLASEMEFGGPGPLSIPLWVWNGIFPLAFGLISVKYLLLFLLQLKALMVKDKG